MNRESNGGWSRRALVRGLAWGTAAAIVPRWRPAIAAEAYPTHPVTLVVPFGAGSGTDILSRVIAKRLAQDFGQPVVVENRPGANGILGSVQVARARPDGYTLIMGTIASHSINALVMKKPAYDVVRDFEPISLVAQFPTLLAVNKDLPANDIRQLVQLSKERGGLSFASGGVGSSGQMAAELLKLQTGANLVHVPYKEIGQAISDTIAGHIPIIFYQVPALLPHITAGNLKALAVLSTQRAPLLPDVSTPAEQGIQDFDATAWIGLFGPAGLPAPIVERVNQAVATALQDAELKKTLIPQGFTLIGGTPDEFKRFVANDIQKWGRVIKAANLQFD